MYQSRSKWIGFFSSRKPRTKALFVEVRGFLEDNDWYLTL